MINQLLRVAILAGIWRRYKGVIISTLLLFGFWFLLSFLHGEYIDFASNTGSDSHIGLSFFIKWGLGITALLVYGVYHYIGALHQIQAAEDARAAQQPRQTQKPKPPQPGDGDYRAEQDPFAQLRDKPRLRSRGDFELEGKLDKPD
ncbi:MAG: hypothetical protein OIF35_04760 [Cellvibrionaceae bacterium]|nr:hypothetical protein [Cellvibrionaceae bacterium]